MGIRLHTDAGKGSYNDKAEKTDPNYFAALYLAWLPITKEPWFDTTTQNTMVQYGGVNVVVKKNRKLLPAAQTGSINDKVP